MKITKNWLYIISDKNIKKIIIEDNLNVIIFDELNILENIEIWKNSIVDIFWYIQGNNNYDLWVSIIWENSSLKLWYLLISWDSEEIKAKITSKVKASNSNIKIKIIWIVSNNWKIDIDWTLDILPWLKEINWDLIEENIFIWNSGYIKSIPNLFVWSNDVKVSHSCKMERISDEKLFYLRKMNS
jgi:hypothetical protein